MNKILLTLPLLLSLQHLVFAAPAAAQSAATAVSPNPYRLTLSLADGAFVPFPSAPKLTLNLINQTLHHELILRWMPPYDVVFHVAYKSATDDPGLETGWKQVASNPPPPGTLPDIGSLANPISHGTIVITEEHVEKIRLLPQHQEVFPFTPGFPMSNSGFYRITAMMTVQAYEFDAPPSPGVLLRKFDLTVSSKPFIVRRTTDGYTPMDLTVGKQAASP